MGAFRSRQARAEASGELIRKHELAVEEVAELFRFSPELIRRAVWDGELRARTLGREISGIARDDLIEWLKARDAPAIGAYPSATHLAAVAVGALCEQAVPSALIRPPPLGALLDPRAERTFGVPDITASTAR